MKYRVICELECRVRSREWVVDDREIEADNVEVAALKFKARYQYCPRCIGFGTKVCVLFDDRLYPEVLPPFE
jgi:hypothetical protein